MKSLLGPTSSLLRVHTGFEIPQHLFLFSLHAVLLYLLCLMGLLLLGQFFLTCLNTPSPLPWASPPGDILFALQEARKGPHLHAAAPHHPEMI